MSEAVRAARVLALYRDAPLRREALAAPAGAGARYSLFGLDELRASGLDVTHNLVPEREPSRGARALGRHANRLLGRAGGYGGDFATVLACRRAIAAADVVLSTVDTVGIPLVLARRSRLVARTPVVYVSVGLLDRVGRLRGERMRRRYRDAVGSVDAVVAYGHAEAEQLREWLAPLDAPPAVEFVPFGVDTAAFAPLDVEPDVDVVSVGADPQRDYGALARLATSLSHASFRAVVAPEREAELAGLPNLTVETRVPFAAIPGRLAHARVVVLPVRENAYSGATTTLLQALAMARPVVVSRTSAIAEGYGLVDDETCRLVPAGDDDALAGAVAELLEDPARAAAMGERGRSHVAEHLGWERFAGRIRGVLVRAAGTPGAGTV